MFVPESLRTNSRHYWDKMEVSYRPAYAFEEVLAAFGDASGATGAADTMLSQMESVAQIVAGDPDLRSPEVLDDDRATVLERYAFDGKGPEGQVRGEPDPQQRDEHNFRRLVIAKEQIWRYSSFDWRMLLSRRELELINKDDVRLFGREASSFIVQSERAQELFRKINAMFFVCFLAAAAALGVTWSGPFHNAESLRPLVAIAVAISAYFVVAALSSFQLNMRRDVPYGLSFKKILALVMIGPLRPEIRDYDASDS